MGQSTYMYGPYEAETYEPVKLISSSEVADDVNQGYVKKQHRADSFMEAVCNTFVGFWISFFTWIFIVAPIFGFGQSVSDSFLITTIFTVMSIIRGYVLRRLFDGKTIWETIRGRFTA